MSLLDNFVNCRMCIKGSQKSMLKFAARVLHNEWGTIVFGRGQFKAIFLHYQHCISFGDCLVIARVLDVPVWKATGDGLDPCFPITKRRLYLQIYFQSDPKCSYISDEFLMRNREA